MAAISSFSGSSLLCRNRSCHSHRPVVRITTCDSTNSPSDKMQDIGLKSSLKTPALPARSSLRDWRSFRASLVLKHDVENDQSWAHELGYIEPGCLLVSTSLHKHPLLQGSVVLILDCSSDGSYQGLVLNKAIPFSAEDLPHVQPEVISLAALSCSTFIAGPLMPHSCKPEVHTLTSSSCLRGYERISRGVYLGDESSLSSTLDSVRRQCVKPEEVRVLVNKMVWEKKQLEVEIRSMNWWKIVSCSSNAWIKVPVAQLWISLHGLLDGQTLESQSMSREI